MFLYSNKNYSNYYLYTIKNTSSIVNNINLSVKMFNIIYDNILYIDCYLVLKE